MAELIQRIIRKIRFIYSFIKSIILGTLTKNRYRTIKTFVLFIGYPRSGHSLIAALLDAHPNIVIGMEWGVVPHLKLGYNQLQILYSITHNAKRFRKRENNIWTGYSYKVNNWQGKFDKIYIIGDKLGGTTTTMFFENFNLLSMISSKINFPIKYIHVIRNPFDVISTSTKRYFEKNKIERIIEPIDLLPFIKDFFNRANVIYQMKTNNMYQIYDLYHEVFIAKPEPGLKDLMSFLEIQYDFNYIEDCVKIIYKEPHKSRFDIDWPDDLIHFVESLISKYDFLSSYSFVD